MKRRVVPRVPLLAILSTVLLLTAFLLTVALLTAGTPASTQPVVKIGLIAPFEGLYRRTGYEALEAMRLAIVQAGAMDASGGELNVDVDMMNADIMDVDIALLPLALNDGNRAAEAKRAAQKLLLDPAVVAVVGPLTPHSADEAADVLGDSPVAWFPPFAISPQLATAPVSDGAAANRQIAKTSDVSYNKTSSSAQLNANEWATELVTAVAKAARSQGAQRLVFAGDGVGWPTLSMQAWESVLAMPVSALTSPAQVEATDAVLWLGDVASGAAYFAQLRRTQAEVPFWLGPTGDDPVFAEHVAAQDLSPGDGVYWATWLDENYAEWRQKTGMSPSAYLVYRATQYAIATAASEPAQPSAAADNEGQALQVAGEVVPHWEIYLFELSDDGTSSPISVSHP